MATEFERPWVFEVGEQVQTAWPKRYGQVTSRRIDRGHQCYEVIFSDGVTEDRYPAELMKMPRQRTTDKA